MNHKLETVHVLLRRLSGANVNWTVSKNDSVIFLHLYMDAECEFTSTIELEQAMLTELITLSLQINQEPIQATSLYQKTRIIYMPQHLSGHGTFVIRSTVEDTHVVMEISQIKECYPTEQAKSVEVVLNKAHPVELSSLMPGQYFRYVTDNIKAALEIHKVSQVQTSQRKGLVKIDCFCEPSVSRSLQGTTKVYFASKPD